MDSDLFRSFQISSDRFRFVQISVGQFRLFWHINTCVTVTFTFIVMDVVCCCSCDPGFTGPRCQDRGSEVKPAKIDGSYLLSFIRVLNGRPVSGKSRHWCGPECA